MSKKQRNGLGGGIREPMYDTADGDKLALIRALNFYSAHAENRHLKRWAVEWAQKQDDPCIDPNRLKCADDGYFRTYGALARLLTHGGFPPTCCDIQQRLRSHLLRVASMVTDAAVQEQHEKYSHLRAPRAQQIANNKEKYLNELRTLYILAMHQDTFTPVDFAGWFRERDGLVKVLHLRHAAEYFVAEREKYGADTRRARVLDQLVTDITSCITEMKPLATAPRLSSTTTSTVVNTTNNNDTSHLKFLAQHPEDDEIESVEPSEIPGCKVLWTYNVRYNQLSVYHAKDDSGLSVKGTTIHNFDEDRSALKRPPSRRALDIIREICEGPSEVNQKTFDSIQRKSMAVKGRTGNDTLLLFWAK